MFNLDHSIATWRQQMLAAGIQSPVPLVELETHLRDEIEAQLHRHASPQEAFEAAVLKIGIPARLQDEFANVPASPRKTALQLGAAIVCLLAGAGLMVPGNLQLQQELVMSNTRFGLWAVAWVLIFWSLGSLHHQFRLKSSARRLQTVTLSPSRQALKTTVGILILLTGIALMFPALWQAIRTDRVPFAELGYMTFGIALLVAGLGVTFNPYKKRIA